MHLGLSGGGEVYSQPVGNHLKTQYNMLLLYFMYLLLSLEQSFIKTSEFQTTVLSF